MKKMIIFATAMLPVFLFGGCQTEQKTEAQNEFEQDLRGLYSDVQAITSQAQTRSLDGEFVPPTEEEWEVIFAEISRIHNANGTAEIIAVSPYYKGEALNFAEMDMYDILQWVEKNGTPEFYNFMLEVGEEVLDIEQIIANPNLLPNEKLALITNLGLDWGTGITLEDQEPDSNSPVSDCADAYRVDRKACARAAEIEATLGLISIAFPPSVVPTYTGIGATYAVCMGVALGTFTDCLEATLN